MSLPATSRRSLWARGSGVVVAVAALALTACAGSPPRRTEDDRMEYLRILQRLEAQEASLEPGSAAETRAIERFESLLSDFKAPDFEQRVGEVYAEDAFFNDTLKTLRGAAEIQEYLGETAEAIDRGTVEFLDVVADNGNYYFRWSMTIRFKRFDSSEDKFSIGMSHIRFDRDGRVVLHQDYWDSSAGLFEHVPVVGWMLHRVKKRL